MCGCRFIFVLFCRKRIVRKENFQIFNSLVGVFFVFLLLLITRRLMRTHFSEPLRPWFSHMCGRHREKEARGGRFESPCRPFSSLSFEYSLTHSYFLTPEKQGFSGHNIGFSISGLDFCYDYIHFFYLSEANWHFATVFTQVSDSLKTNE